jgi:hypothetical protein
MEKCFSPDKFFPNRLPILRYAQDDKDLNVQITKILCAILGAMCGFSSAPTLFSDGKSVRRKMSDTVVMNGIAREGRLDFYRQGV